MAPVDVDVVVGGEHALPGRLRLPACDARGGVVCLHPAGGPGLDYHLFGHLADLLAPLGIAVLRYDRRAAVDDGDVPFDAQARDAGAALELLGSHVGDAPCGLWAFSQGAWAAPLVASGETRVEFLVLVGAPGVSPAAQMRYSTREHLRRSGHADPAIEEAVAVREVAEGFLRGDVRLETAQAELDRVAGEAWFPLTHLPLELREGMTWADMDFDPGPSIAAVGCPTLLVYGEEEEVVPVGPSLAAWRASASAAAGTLDIVTLPGIGHEPVDASGEISAVYAGELQSWLDRQLPAAG